jgi:hypothetical protein
MAFTTRDKIHLAFGEMAKFNTHAHQNPRPTPQRHITTLRSCFSLARLAKVCKKTLLFSVFDFAQRKRLIDLVF